MRYPNNTLKDLNEFLKTITAQKILLSGPLGAGKTTFTKQRATKRGVSPEHVTSPTYTYSQIYDDRILHIDMRRIESAEELVSLGLVDMIYDHNIVIIERPKWTELYTDESWSHIDLEYESENGSRTIAVSV